MTNNKIQTNQKTTISIPKIEYIPTDRRMWNSIKRRVKISDRIFDLKDIVLLFIWSVLWWWVSFFSVEDTKKSEYLKWLILLSVIAFISALILLWIKKQKKEFTDTVLEDMNDVESWC